MRERILELWTIFFDPSDFPGKYVVRKFYVERGEPAPAVVPDDTVIVTDTLAEARANVPQGTVNLGRYAEDDSKILETWV